MCRPGCSAFVPFDLLLSVKTANVPRSVLEAPGMLAPDLTLSQVTNLHPHAKRLFFAAIPPPKGLSIARYQMTKQVPTV
jgi:hypothetical protein